MHGPLLIPRVPPGSFITTQISPVSAIGGAGPGCWLGDSGSSSRSVSTGTGEGRGERREGDILVTLHLAPGHLGTWNLGKVAAGVSRGEYSGPWRGWHRHRAVSSSGPVLWLSAVIVTGQGVTVTPEVNTHGVTTAQCPVCGWWRAGEQGTVASAAGLSSQ